MPIVERILRAPARERGSADLPLLQFEQCLVGLLQFDVIALVFGSAGAMLTRLVYMLIGVAALWQLYPLVRAVQTDEILAESAAHR